MCAGANSPWIVHMLLARAKWKDTGSKTFPPKAGGKVV